MNINKVCGKFPEVCYKAYKCEEYAKQFIDKGTFHMGCLLSYREIEDESRRDPTEGYGRTKEPGVVTVGWVSPNPAEKTIWTRENGHQEHHSEFGNAMFCFCTCLPDVNRDHMKGYFISKGQRFLIDGCKVVYNKGQKLGKKLTDNERLDLSYKQKPEGFIPDCEFRIVAIKLGDPCPDECKYLSGQFEQVEPKCKFIEVNLGRQLDYLSFVTLK